MGKNKDNKFINEKILGRNLTWRRILKLIFVSLLCGLVFGAAAFFVFWFARGKAQALMEKEAKTAAETAAAAEIVPETGPVTETEPQITEPETEEETENTAEGETAPEDAEALDDERKAGQAEETVPFGEEDVLELIEKEREEYEYTLSDYKKLSKAQQEAVADASVHFVTIECIISETTWFESTIETKRLYSGVIISQEEDEILVLTVPDAASDGVSLSVRFSDGTKQNAILKAYSARDRLAVLSVPTEGLGKDFLEKVSPIEYAEKKTINPGTQLITAGAPLGAVGSYDFGYIGYVSDPVSTVDGSITYCLADVNSNVETGTFFIDLDGKLIGAAAEPVKGSGCAAAVTAESINYIIESLKKGREMAYLGISGMDTSYEMKYKKIPEGMYVTELEEGCPAYEAGMKPGDILVLAGNREIKGTEDYKSFMRNLRPGDTAAMTVMRTGAAGEYKKLELTMTAGTRE